MDEICNKLWNKLNEYNKTLAYLDKENLYDTFKDCKTPEDCKKILESIKTRINLQYKSFEKEKLIEFMGKKVIWKDVLIVKDINIRSITVDEDNNISYISIKLNSQDELKKLSKLPEHIGLDLSFNDLSKFDLSVLKNFKNLKKLSVVSCSLSPTQEQMIRDILEPIGCKVWF